MGSKTPIGGGIKVFLLQKAYSALFLEGGDVRLQRGEPDTETIIVALRPARKRITGVIMKKVEKSENVYYRRIGKTLYKVTVHTSKTETETARDKIIRMIQNQVSTNTKVYGIFESQQMSLPSERRVS